jgi:hypothetical protein
MGLLAVLSAAIATSAAAAPTKQYLLKHPKRERCRAHYVRKARTVKIHGKHVREVWCVRVTPKPTAPQAPESTPAPTPTPTPASPPVTLTPTFTNVTFLELGGFGTGLPRYDTVSVGVGTVSGPGLIGVPVTVTLVNQTTLAPLGSFTEASHEGTCTIVNELVGGNWVLKGEAVSSYPACPIGTISAPSEQSIGIQASFAGSAQYAPSTSKEQLFV